MTRREELVIEGMALATDYYTSYTYNKGEEIKKVFREYDRLVVEDDLVDKKMVGALMVIMDIFYMKEDEIEEDALNGAYSMIETLSGICESWCPNFIKLITDGIAELEMDGEKPLYYDEILAWIRKREERMKKRNFKEVIKRV